ncbi:hypothetical protein [Chryseobacterium vrystaatense]|uniref:DUF4440 domain-containing protein n=1 Tax=Chryseobacterium vrystaatense TaxID=307480 RepID=A0A1M5NGY6_9FLAO|nr:hypothetical protein [Chryseobacterium vrystaatense]SHG88479.1 hypothetical protein SAMN02787073_4984 [Chryseobacterium vrystaatense]
MNNTDKIIKEIKEFHTDIEAWFRGKEDQESLYRKLLSGFDSDFKMVNGHHNTVTLAAFSEWLPGAFGQFPDRSIVVENIEVQTTESHGMATYIEIQTTGSTLTKRKSSAVFVINEDKALWLHLIEKWI